MSVDYGAEAEEASVLSLLQGNLCYGEQATNGNKLDKWRWVFEAAD